MPQDRSSGARASEWGHSTARLLAEELGATGMLRSSNECQLAGERIVIKCANPATGSVGVTYRMLERLDRIVAAFKLDDGSFELLSLLPSQFKSAMRKTCSRGSAAGKSRNSRAVHFSKIGQADGPCMHRALGVRSVEEKEFLKLLYSVPDLKKIDGVPHAGEYRRWRANLNRVDPNAYTRISAELDARFEGREVDTSSWIPGADWRNTPFQPLYEACQQDEVAAGLFFGLIVWDVVVHREEDCWSFGRYEKGGAPIRGMTYFRIDCPD